MSSRSATLAKRELVLSEEDPLLRLKEFCRIGMYKYSFAFDVFKNGTLVTCEIYFEQKTVPSPKTYRHYLGRETRFVSTLDSAEAQRVVAAVLLDNFGLGTAGDCDTEDEAENSPAVPPEITQLATQGMGMVQNLMKSMSAQVQSDVAPSTEEVD